MLKDHFSMFANAFDKNKNILHKIHRITDTIASSPLVHLLPPPIAQGIIQGNQALSHVSNGLEKGSSVIKHTQDLVFH